MADPLREDVCYTIVDPLQHDAFESSLGTLQTDAGGYIRTRNKDLMQELRQREPWLCIAEHEVEAGGKALRGQSIVRVVKTWESPSSAQWVNEGNGRWKYVPRPGD